MRKKREERGRAVMIRFPDDYYADLEAWAVSKHLRVATLVTAEVMKRVDQRRRAAERVA